MGPLTLLAVISVLTCFLNSGSAAAPQQRSTEAGHETVTLQWRTNLRSAIGSAPIWEDLGSSVESKARPRTSLWFTDNRTIVATFVTREGNPSLSNRDASDATLPRAFARCSLMRRRKSYGHARLADHLHGREHHRRPRRQACYFGRG